MPDIHQCSYCGEIISSPKQYCSNCSTQKGRKKIFDETVEIFKENKSKGFAIPETLKNWR
jgi:hypothetical protein